METIADLHIHSYLSRACSPQLRPETLHGWAQRKGIGIMATGDFTHPAWFAELQEKLVPAEPGLFKLRAELAKPIDSAIPASCRAPVRFILGVEVSCIYKKNGKLRRVHHLLFASSFESAGRINASLGKIGNIKSDGRPILGLDSRTLLSMVRDSAEDSYLVPAHAWTPHFGIFGSESGYDAMEECFEDLTPEVFAIETGLSSNPAMNWRVSALDKLSLISCSDAHSPEKLGREATVFDIELSYRGLFDALRRKNPKGLRATLEFFPEEGKYYLDGHRACRTSSKPAETIKQNGICPVCRNSVTAGVLYRVERLADSLEGRRPSTAVPFESLVPLKEIIGETLQVGPASVKVAKAYDLLLEQFGNELNILRKVSADDIATAGFSLLALALQRMRKAETRVNPGYDGEYGSISFLNPEDFATLKQPSLLSR